MELLRARCTQQTIQIFVRGLEGKTHTLYLRPSSTVIDLKESLMNYEGFLPESQRLTFAGKELLEDPKSQNKTQPKM